METDGQIILLFGFRLAGTSRACQAPSRGTAAIRSPGTGNGITLWCMFSSLVIHVLIVALSLQHPVLNADEAGEGVDGRGLGAVPIHQEEV